MPQLTNSAIKEQRDAAFRFRGQQITYVTTNDSTDVKTGTVTENDSTTTIGDGASDDPGVLVGQISDSAVANSGGRYHVGDLLFKIRDGDLPVSVPKTTHEIQFNGDTYKVIEHNKSADGNVWEILGREPN